MIRAASAKYDCSPNLKSESELYETIFIENEEIDTLLGQLRGVLTKKTTRVYESRVFGIQMGYKRVFYSRGGNIQWVKTVSRLRGKRK